MRRPGSGKTTCTVAAAGIIEAVNENVGIAPPVQGVVTKGHVVVGDQVEVGTPLLQLDEETSEAAIASARVQWESRRALTLSTTQLPKSTVRVA